jgi:multidrug resistance efflux pump
MKEIIIPYILLMWILVSTGAIKWSLKSAVWIVSGGVLILVILGIMSRLWAPVDLTYSSTVKAPHAVLSPLFGEEIDHIFVVHNQVVKKGDIIYTLVDTNSVADIEKIKAAIMKENESISQQKRDLRRAHTSPEIFKSRDVEKFKSEVKVAKASVLSLQADLEKTLFAQERKNG